MANPPKNNPRPKSTPDSPPPTPDAAPPRPPRRPVYESSLLPARRHRRLSPWLVVPGLLLALGLALYFLIFAPAPRRFVPTAGAVVYAADTNTPGLPHLWIAPDAQSQNSQSGSQPRPLTSGPAPDSAPTFSADGSQVAFLSARVGGLNQIFVADADGKNVFQVTRGGSAKAAPAFAPGSNSLLGFLSGPTLSVVTDLAKGDATPILPTPGQNARPDSTDPGQTQGGQGAVTAFAWKPGGDPARPGLAAVLENGGVQTLAVLPALDGTLRVTQTDKPGGPPLAAAGNVAPVWAPDGTKMAVALLDVQGLPGGKRASGLLLFDGQGNVQRPLFPLVSGAGIGPQNPVYSPDGSQIAFELWRQPDLASRARLGLFIVPADGSGPPRPLARGDAGSAQWTPDGKQLFFLAVRKGGGHDLYRINADGSGPARVSDGTSDVSGFALSPQAAKP